MRYVIGIVLLAVLAMGVGGCATIFSGAETSAQKADRVLSAAQGAVDAVAVVARMAGLDVATPEEKAAFDAALAQTKTGLVNMTAVVEQIVARHDAERLPDAQAVSADAAALP